MDDYNFNPLILDEDNEQGSKPKKKVLIVNLSVLHDLKSQAYVLKEFIKLGQCPFFDFFEQGFNFLANKNFSKIIDQYKTGQINTDTFIENLIQESNFKIDEKYFDPLFMSTFFTEHKDQLFYFHTITLEKFNNLSSKEKYDLIKKALMEKAWNSFIELNDSFNTGCYSCFFSPATSTKDKFSQLNAYARENSFDIYFISNTNPLNIFKIFKHLSPYSRFDETCFTNIMSSRKKTMLDKNIKIINSNALCQIHLATSYNYNAFKTLDETAALMEDKTISSGTPDILSQLCIALSKQGITTNEVFLVSQYDKDINAAKSMGIPSNNISSAKTFFEKTIYEKAEPSKTTKFVFQ